MREDPMASRREFLQVGFAALTLPISARAAFSPAVSAPTGEAAPTPLYKVVFDERFPASVQFAERAKKLGASVYRIKGDITGLWFHDLYYRWNESPVAIAGLTAHGPIFCLERIAWDHRMRVVFRADHKRLPDGSMEHAVSAPESVLRRAADLGGDGPNWGSRVADLLTHFPQGRSTSGKATFVTPMAGPTGDDPEPLVSWVIAPVRSA
jgi:hypothetical protein